MTYSIVARDPETGELGVGVQTNRPTVGAVVPWVEPGIGAVATQSRANVSFGRQALDLMRTGPRHLFPAKTCFAKTDGHANRHRDLCRGPVSDRCEPFNRLDIKARPQGAETGAGINQHRSHNQYKYSNCSHVFSLLRHDWPPVS
ncbi:MAG: DUF1028 domain-containing protein [Planctomycetes bacterium]|nr:DUF1028 domain-containing protein [Planctomycetota bacterium]